MAIECPLTIEVGATEQYYPVLHSAFWLLHHLFGDSAPAYHLLNVALHLGTLGSILVVYRRDLRFVLRDFKLCAWIVLATIPAAVVGLKFKDQIEATFEKPAIVAVGSVSVILYDAAEGAARYLCAGGARLDSGRAHL